MPDLSILTCAAGREDLYAAHVAALSEQAGIERCEYILTTWGEDTVLRKLAENVGTATRISSVPGDCRLPLPRAYNECLRNATSAKVLVLGAEVIVPPGFVSWALAADCEGVAWIPGCMDSKGPRVLCGPSQPGAWPYAMVCSTEALRAIGGWDEEFCDGIVFDDVDLALRMVASGVRFSWDFDQTVIHQHHERVYVAEGRERYANRNRQIVERRLGGYPMADVWPAWWRELYTGRPRQFPALPGHLEQAQLQAQLHQHGYPIRGSVEESPHAKDDR